MSMHSVHDDKAGRTIHFNSDGSGDAVVQERNGREIRLPFRLIVAAVAKVARAERIEVLEQASDEEIVGIR